VTVSLFVAGKAGLALEIVIVAVTAIGAVAAGRRSRGRSSH
jgi:hypothetical protein